MSDQEAFLAKLRAGDERAWRRLMTEQGRLVLFAARRVGVAGEDAEDVFQIAFLSAYRAISSLQRADRLATWLYRIAHRAAIDHLRRRRVSVPLDEVAPVADDAEPIDRALERLDEGRRVRDAVEALDDRCRELLSALYLEQPRPSYQEIAKRLGMAIGSIGPTQARCLAKLAHMFGHVSNEDDMRSSTPNADGRRHEDAPAAPRRAGRPERPKRSERR